MFATARDIPFRPNQCHFCKDYTPPESGEERGQCYAVKFRTTTPPYGGIWPSFSGESTALCPAFRPLDESMLDPEDPRLASDIKASMLVKRGGGKPWWRFW